MHRLFWLTSLLVACSLPGCVLGAEEPPGCRLAHPEDCESGWTCRAGVCMRPSTSLTSPEAGLADSQPDGSLAEGGDAPDATSDVAHEAAQDAAEEGAAADVALPDGGVDDAAGDGIQGLDGAEQDGTNDAALD